MIEGVRAVGIASSAVAEDLLPRLFAGAVPVRRPRVGELLVGAGVRRERRTAVREEVREALVDLDRHLLPCAGPTERRDVVGVHAGAGVPGHDDGPVVRGPNTITGG